MKQIFTILPKCRQAFCLAICFLLFTTATSFARIYNITRLYVAQGASGDGSAWDNALGSLDGAINIAAGNGSITEIWVKSGTYYPSTKPLGTFTVLQQDNAFTLLNGVAIYGGFAGTETSLSQRNLRANTSILSGDIGTPNDNSDNCYHVVVSINNNSTAVLDGFTITAGNAINANFALFAGLPVFRSAGGGLTLFNSSPLITNCTITGNTASTGGGGLFQIAGNTKISNCVFSNNSAAYGGAVRNESTPALTIINSVFSGNSSLQSGAALSLYQGTDTLAGNLFIKNYDHGVNQGGGAMCVSDAGFYIVNNTFYADSTNGLGGAIRSESTTGTLQVYNNIFYKNYGALGNKDVDNATVSYTQANNSFSITNPLFVNENDPNGADNIWATADDGMNLQVASPAYDAGDNSKVPTGLATDIAGRQRIFGSIVDLGAYEGDQYTYTTIYVDSSVAVAGNGGTWATAFKTMSDAVKISRRFSNIDSILVAKGTYYPTGSQTGTARDSAFVIARGGLKLYGGYASGGGARNLNLYPTYLDGNINTAGVSPHNSYHLLVIVGIGSGEDSIVVDGFTLRNGVAIPNPSIPDVNGNIVTKIGGGGAVLEDIKNGQKTLLRHCTFSNNTALNEGGALTMDGGLAAIDGCVFSGNTAKFGGAISVYNPVFTVFNSVFTGNVSSNYGGAISLFAGTNTVVNNLFVKNKDNNATQGGGAISTNGGDVYIANNTFYADSANAKGGAIGERNAVGTLSLFNNIFYKNNSLSGDSDVDDITTVYTQANNSFGTTDPLFVNEADLIGIDGIWGTADDGMNLQLTSTALDTGDNSKVPAWLTTDIAGKERILGGIVDLGAYESDQYTYTTIYVDSSVAVAGNGSTWATAFKTMSDAVKTARSFSNIDSILVAKGTYYPTGGQSGTARDSSFVIARGGLKLYGGYPSGGGTRNISQNNTFLDGDINTAGTTTDNSYHIMVISNIGSSEDSIVVDGFTLRNGSATDSSNKAYNGVPIGNSFGGALAMADVNNGQRTLISHCTFSNNTANLGGGALYQSSGLSSFTGCLFANNTAQYGGAVRNENNPVFTVLNSVFTRNTSAQSGGAMSLFQGNDNIAGNLFIKNRDYGALEGGGAMCVNNGNFYVANNTFYADTTNGYGGAIDAPTGTLRLYNNILYRNSGPGASDLGIFEHTTYLFGNNIMGDPLFVNENDADGADNILGTADDGLNLQPASTGLDGGDNGRLPAGLTTDIAGRARIQDARVNIGAYESSGHFTYTTLYVDSSIAVQGDGGSWATAFRTMAAAVDVAHRYTFVDTILVAKGTYYPGTTTSTGQDVPFAITRGGLKIYGGYPSGGGARNINLNPTCLDGHGFIYHVLVIANIASGEDSIVVDGFTLRNGKAASPRIFEKYNGIQISNGSGAALVIAGVNNGRRTVIRQCTFSNNTANTSGGAVYQVSARSYFTGCVFANNTAQFGSAIRDEDSTMFTIVNSVFTGNVTTKSGGAISSSLGNDTIANNLFIKNIDNGTTAGGGALCLSSANCYIVNNTFYADTTKGNGGAIRSDNASGAVELYNNIFYKNYGVAGFNDINNVTINYTQANNSFSTTDPLFINENNSKGADSIWATADDGLQLQATSPAVDAGSNSDVPVWATTDIRGIKRLVNSAVDMGAYEYAGQPLTAQLKGDTLLCAGGSSTVPVTFSAHGGIQPYTFTYTINGGTNQTVTTAGSDTSVTVNIPLTTAGTFAYTLTAAGDDAGNAVTLAGDTATVNINALPNVTAHSSGFDNSVCFDSRKMIHIDATGGALPYLYSADGSGYKTASNFLVAGGTHTLLVKDANGCTSTGSITLAAPATPLTATAIQTGANTIQVTASGSYGGYKYSLNKDAFHSSPTITTTSTGDEDTIRVQDSKGCTVTKTIVLLSAQLSTINDTVCYGGQRKITANATGGVKPYWYSIDGTTFKQGNNFQVQAGVYAVTVKDANGATITTSSLTITGANKLVIATDIINQNCDHQGTITATATGGFGPYLYKMAGGFNNGFTPNNAFIGLPADTFRVYVQDSLGCENSRQVIITNTGGPCGSLMPATEITSSKAATLATLKVKVYPNPAPVEFTLQIVNGNDKKIVELRVMDMLGKTVYHTTGSVYDMYKFGRTFAGGMYIAEIINGDKVQTIKLVKSN